MISRILVVLAGAMLATSAFPHDQSGPVMDHDMSKGHNKPPPLAILQLDQVRDVASKFFKVEDAEKAGYHDLGLFIPNMGWHYMNDKLVDGRFDPNKPELLVYADDPCGGPRKLVAVEYAVPLSLSKRAPYGFFGNADEWDANQTFQLWTLHAWVYEFNPDGVFAPMNPRVP
jgi:hypothetical protein